MDYKEKVIALLNDQELSKEQKEKLENIFPELQENKDDRIVKCLLNYFNHVRYNGLDLKGTDVDEVIVWLEKQGEKKPTENAKTLDADKVIAWLVGNICDYEYYVKLFKKDFGL